MEEGYVLHVYIIPPSSDFCWQNCNGIDVEQRLVEYVYLLEGKRETQLYL